MWFGILVVCGFVGGIMKETIIVITIIALVACLVMLSTDAQSASDLVTDEIKRVHPNAEVQVPQMVSESENNTSHFLAHTNWTRQNTVLATLFLHMSVERTARSNGNLWKSTLSIPKGASPSCTKRGLPLWTKCVTDFSR